MAGKQIVPADWLKRSTTPAVTIEGPARYGWHWYLRDAPTGAPPSARTISAVGWGGQRLFILPGLELVVAMNAGNYRRPGMEQSVSPTRLLTELVLAEPRLRCSVLRQLNSSISPPPCSGATSTAVAVARAKATLLARSKRLHGRERSMAMVAPTTAGKFLRRHDLDRLVFLLIGGRRPDSGVPRIPPSPSCKPFEDLLDLGGPRRLSAFANFTGILSDGMDRHHA